MKRDATSPTVDDKYPKRQAPSTIEMAGDEAKTSAILQKLLEGQESMQSDLQASLSQNPELRKRLCDTGNCTLYEATSKQFWGCGLRINSRLWTSGMIPGKNHMGQILMRVRAKMRDSHAQLNEGKPSTVTSTTYTY